MGEGTLVIKVALVTANTGSYDTEHKHVHQVIAPELSLDYFYLNDTNFQPRNLAMTSRLQCGIPKMFAWQLFPKYDFYIWCDASCQFQCDDSVMWFMNSLSPLSHIGLIKHPTRKTIYEEYKFLKTKLEEKNRYLTKRYANEFLDQQWETIKSDHRYIDDTLYASTCFIYRNTKIVQDVLKEWWYHKSRFLIHDQLALPYVVGTSDCVVSILDTPLYESPYFTYVRNKK
jgi:hypothetical protein